MTDPTTVVTGIAEHLAANGVGVWSPEGKYTSQQVGITDTVVPAKPDQLVVLSLYPGDTTDAGGETHHGWTTPRLQVRTRAGTDPRVARDLDAAVRDLLHGLGPVTLPNGVALGDCYSLQSAAMPLGADANGRWEFSRNYQLTIDN